MGNVRQEIILLVSFRGVKSKVRGVKNEIGSFSRFAGIIKEYLYVSLRTLSLKSPQNHYSSSVLEFKNQCHKKNAFLFPSVHFRSMSSFEEKKKFFQFKASSVKRIYPVKRRKCLRSV